MTAYNASGTISGNTLTKGVNGIVVDYANNCTVSGNTIQNMAINWSTSDGSSMGWAITLDECSSGNTVSCNSITDNELGIWVSNGANNNTFNNNLLANNLINVQVDSYAGAGCSGASTGLQFHNNSFGPLSVASTAVAGFINNTAVLVDASGNWWGDNTPLASTHPTVPAVTAIVDYTPWLDSGANAALPPCFQGDFSTLWASAASPQAGNLGPIQEGISLIADGSLTGCARVLNVVAGTYIENVVIDRAVQVLGPNVGVPGTGARVAEAFVRPAIDDNQGNIPIIAVEANCIRIDGFTLDGNNPALPVLGDDQFVGGVAVDAGNGIQNGVYGSGPAPSYGLVNVDHITIDNNIFRNNSYAGVYLWDTYGVNNSWNYARNNYFVNMWEGIQTYALHADISNNTFDSVNRGLSMHQVNVAADPGFVPQIVNNNITISLNSDDSRNCGLWVNGRQAGAPALAVSGNTVNVPASMGSQSFSGLIIWDVVDACQVSLANNTVNGFGNANIGVDAWNITSTSPVILSGGSLNNIQNIGVEALSYDDPQWGPANTALTVDNVPITMTGAGSIGVEAFADPVNAPANSVVVIVQNGTAISGESTGVLVLGPLASAKVIDEQRFAGRQRRGCGRERRQGPSPRQQPCWPYDRRYHRAQWRHRGRWPMRRRH